MEEEDSKREDEISSIKEPSEEREVIVEDRTYRKYSSPHPSPTKDPEEDENVASGGKLRAESEEIAIGEPKSPAPSMDRLSVSFAMKDEEEEIKVIQSDEGSIRDEEAQKESESKILSKVSKLFMNKTMSQKDLKPKSLSSEDRRSSGDSADLFADSILDIPRLRRGGRQRGSSIFTTSSMESAFTSRKDRIENEVKLHKEIIEQVKYQFWPLDKKLRVIMQSKEYLKRHKSEMEERLAQNKTLGSILKQVQIFVVKCLCYVWKLLCNFLTELTPWQRKIKQIESHFGSVVSSYFVFLRWLFWMNFTITLVILIFIMIPEIISVSWEDTGARKVMLPVEEIYSKNLKVMWNFEGIFRYSPIFYGFYGDGHSTKMGYRLPLAYFCVGMSVYIYSFVIILRKMAQNSKQSKLSEKGDECTFSWKIYTSWDYGIANVEAAHNKVASIVMGLREALVERQEKEKQLEKNWKIIAKRVCANFIVLGILVGTAYAVVLVVERSESSEAASSWYRQNEITIVMSLISIIVPNFFDLISLLEAYHPRKAMRWMLGRIMVLNLLSLYTLIFALFGKTDGMIGDLEKMEVMLKGGTNFGLQLSRPLSLNNTIKDCFTVPVPCRLLSESDQDFLAPSMDQLINDVSKKEFTNESLSVNCTECIRLCEQNCAEYCESLGLCNGKGLANETLNGTSSIIDVLGSFSSSDDPCLSCFLNARSPPETKKPLIPISEKDNPENCNVKICRNEYLKRKQKFNNETEGNLKRPPSMNLERCSTAVNKFSNDLKDKIKLRKLCWETMFGQELVKLTIMDTVFTLFSIFIGDFGRSLFLRFMNPCWFWNMEKKFPKYPDFKVAENVLHLVNNQGMIWMGLFMAPGLPAINLVKLVIIMNARCWAIMTSNIPHETVFKAGSNNFYFVLLLQMLFLCTLPVAYTIVWLKPSWHCGPFSKYDRIYKVLTELIIGSIPKELHGVLDYISSPGVVIPVFLLMSLIIYYQSSLTGLLRESNDDLKNQLHYERTEERRKLLQNKQAGSKKGQDIQERWKSLLGQNLFSEKKKRRSSEISEKTMNQDVQSIPNEEVSADRLTVPMKCRIENERSPAPPSTFEIPDEEDPTLPQIRISTSEEEPPIIELITEDKEISPNIRENLIS